MAQVIMGMIADIGVFYVVRISSSSQIDDLLHPSGKNRSLYA